MSSLDSPPNSAPVTSGFEAVRRLALAVSIATGVLLMVGATVSATGAGLACPDWPLCRGRLIPPFEPLVLIEYSHRVLASAVGVMMLALAALVWRRAGPYPSLRGLIVVLLVLLAVQVGLGGATVLTELVPGVVGAHLVIAMTFLALLVMLTARAYWETDPSFVLPASPSGLAAAVRVALAATFLQIVLGGFTSALGAGLACPDFPLCGSRLIPQGDPLVVLHSVHRLVAFILVVALATVASRARQSSDRATRVAAALAMLLVIIQVALGALNVMTRLAVPVRVAHLGGAAALLATLMALSVRVRLARPAVAAMARTGAVRARTGGMPLLTRVEPAASRPGAADYLSLMKPRIIVLLLVTTFTTMIVAAGRAGFAPLLMVYTMLGGALAAGAANAINCYWDRDIDAVMRRTRTRPLPSGRITPGRALAFGLVLSAVAVMVLGFGVNWLAAALAASGILFYVGVYTIWLKRSTPQNIVIGGAAGAIPPLVGWAAITNDVGLPALLLFAIIFLWTPPHFWALALYRTEDYRAAGIPMLPVVRGETETVRQIALYTLALIGTSLALAMLGVLGRIYLVSAVALALPLVVLVVRLIRETNAKAAWALFAYSILYLGLLFASMAVDRLFA